MSVAELTSQELGVFAGICVKLDLLPLDDVCRLCEIVSTGNRQAWEHQYNDSIPIVTADDIEREALHVLAKPELMIDRCFGPLAYNMITNDGTTYDDSGKITQCADILKTVRELEEKVNKWQEAKQREKDRQAENDEAYEEVGPLEVLTTEEIKEKCKAAGCQRVIYASFECNESETQSDYWGSRTARTVVIGFGKGKRENFKQLRKAAATFPPTEGFGPGQDEWVVWVNHEEQTEENKYCPQTRVSQLFTTEAEAESWIQSEMSKVEPEGDYSQNGICAKNFGYKNHCESVENRENYSMGGGNYLGYSRYSGWKVSSTIVEWFNGSGCEFFEPPKRRKATKAATTATGPQTAEVQKHYHSKREVDFWLVVLSERVDRPQFESIRSNCKAAGGWYSRKWGSTPGGFAFDNQADAETFSASL